jgi:hypothetical protein
MTVQPEAPPAPAPEPPPAPQAQPAAPPAPPAAQAPAAPVPQPPAQPAPAAPQQPQQPPATAPAADSTDWQAEAERLRAEAATLKQQAEQWKAQSRRQEARSKQNHAQAQGLEGIVRQIAEKLEVPWDDKPDPEVLQQRLAERERMVRELTVERAVYLHAPSAGVNAEALLDSREFAARAAQLDPDAADFGTQVADLVREAGRQPRYQFQQAPAAEGHQQIPAQTPAPADAQSAQQGQVAPGQMPPPQPPAPSSGADFSGSPANDFYWTEPYYKWFIANEKSVDPDGSILLAAMAEGRLQQIGIGRTAKRRQR